LGSVGVLVASGCLCRRSCRPTCDLGEPVDEWISFQHAANKEDHWIVEAQHPEEIPKELKADAHILPDAWSITFRHRCAELGYADY
jgi:hypothetical protein